MSFLEVRATPMKQMFREYSVWETPILRGLKEEKHRKRNNKILSFYV
jgi:hypothetical protein